MNVFLRMAGRGENKAARSHDCFTLHYCFWVTDRPIYNSNELPGEDPGTTQRGGGLCLIFSVTSTAWEGVMMCRMQPCWVAQGEKVADEDFKVINSVCGILNMNIMMCQQLNFNKTGHNRVIRFSFWVMNCQVFLTWRWMFVTPAGPGLTTLPDTRCFLPELPL